MFGFWQRNRSLKAMEKHMAAHRFTEAWGELKPMLDKAPDDALLMFSAAVLYFEQGDKENANQLIDKALSLQPDNPVLHLAKGELLYHKQEHQASMQSLYKSLELSPGNPKAEYLLGLNCLALKRHEQATQHFETVAREDKDFLLARLLTIGELSLR